METVPEDGEDEAEEFASNAMAPEQEPALGATVDQPEPESEPEPEPASGRSPADDARFLIHATFGPTRGTMKALQGQSYMEWIVEQQNLPVESHREYYRMHVNPTSAPSETAAGPPRSPCSKGSRWVGYAFTFGDRSSAIEIRDAESVFVGGRLRTNIERGRMPSSWSGFGNYTGYICFADEFVGGDVHLDTRKDCRSRHKKIVPNPGIWLKRGGIKTTLPFSVMKPAVMILQAGKEGCELEGGGDEPVVQLGQGFYRHEPRMELLANSPENPTHRMGACAPRTFLNERNCLLPDVSARDNTPVPGLLTEVWELGGKHIDYPSRVDLGAPTQVFISQEVDSDPSTGAWPGDFRPRDYYAVRWSGTLRVRQGGAYFFSIVSYNAIRLKIDGRLVVTSDGWHPMRERSGRLDNFTAGDHNLEVEMYSGGGGAGMKLFWQGADSSGMKAIVPADAFSTVPPVGRHTGCMMSCGSPGEAANDPNEGHHMPMIAGSRRRRMAYDGHFDNRHLDRMRSNLGKAAVWSTKALEAKDQLRQRVAWALSQVFVVSSQGFDFNEYSEMWLNYYDIFVRNAFGNFRELLREVTFSPLMGRYLTHSGSSSYDHNKRFPNENYAREVMQLFTIGLDKLNLDGSVVRNANGTDVPTYGMDHILHFARAFTGFVEQAPRANIENTGGNLIDPMRLDVSMRDRYPKPDLDGNFIGDGYPLCEDGTPPHFHLRKGARYEFRGFRNPGGALELSPDSALARAICGSNASDAKCRAVAVTTLKETVKCTGDAECERGHLRFVKAGQGYYEHVPPACVRLLHSATSMVTVAHSGDLVMPNGKVRFRGAWTGDVPVAGTYGSTTTIEAVFTEVPRKAEALARLKVGAVHGGEACKVCGTEVKAYGPNPPTKDTVFEVDGRFFRNIEGRVTITGPRAVVTIGKSNANSRCVDSSEVGGCPANAADRYIRVNRDRWHDGGTFHVSVASGKVCVKRTDDPRWGWHHNMQVACWRNATSIRSFRNPPVFVKDLSQANAERAGYAEVEAVLDHLFNHNNTPMFIGRRLIQRFVSSNPSRAYVQAVGEAFRSGSYGGTKFTGRRGDLAATVAAVLLHPEARRAKGKDPKQTFDGALREPFLKLIHLMRSMEYKDRHNSLVAFKELQEVIGQFPFQAPTVFNFYLADFELPQPEPEPEPETNMTKPEPEPESEPEPEPEPESPPVSPEFQIFTPPYFAGYLNGMSSLINSGISGRDCFPGENLGVSSVEISSGRQREVCPQGSLTWRGAGHLNQTLEELDLLLTGGRLTPKAKEVVQTAYIQAREGQRLQAAQEAIAMTPEFNTLGDPLPLPGVRPPAIGKNGSSQNPYKATIMLFLAGGADTWNLLVPQKCDLYAEYRAIRTDLALSSAELIEIDAGGQACAKFGIHRRFRFLKQLYDKKQAAFVSNVGNLVEPMTKHEFRTGGKRRCFGLFSHSDQQNAAQTLRCQEMGTSARGAGGRIADALAAQKLRTTSFSLAGTAIWPKGITTQREIIDERGSTKIHSYEKWRGAMSNITAQRHGNAYSEAYTQAFLESIETVESLGRVLSSAKLKTRYNTGSHLKRELHQVAKLISARAGRRAERDFFFVSIGGWDMHSNMKQGLDQRFAEIDSALEGFVAEMEAQGIWDSVVLATESEFARTLDSNGGGSDHAWAGNHFVIGGGLNGGRVLNKFPASLKAGNDHDLGRGRLIPDYPWESMMVPIAEWMGLATDQRAATFPNLGLFNSSHIIPMAQLFRS